MILNFTTQLPHFCRGFNPHRSMLYAWKQGLLSSRFPIIETCVIMKKTLSVYALPQSFALSLSAFAADSDKEAYRHPGIYCRAKTQIKISRRAESTFGIHKELRPLQRNHQVQQSRVTTIFRRAAAQFRLCGRKS
jgi:hypothetical protein